MDSRKIQISVGLFVTAAIISMITLGLKASNLNQYAGQESYEITASFNNIGGLKVRSAVKVGGVVVGRVEKIDLDLETLTPKVTMHINTKFNSFSSETSAAILTAGLLGEQYISLTPGGDDEIIQSGDEIYDTQSAVILEDLIGQFLFSKDSGESL